MYPIQNCRDVMLLTQLHEVSSIIAAFVKNRHAAGVKFAAHIDVACMQHPEVAVGAGLETPAASLC